MRRLARMSVVAVSAAALFAAMSGVSYAWTQPLSLCEGSEKDAGGVDCNVGFWTDLSYLDKAGSGWFTAYGEGLTAWDQHADGYGVYAKATWAAGGQSGEVWATGGSGDSKSVDLSFPEGAKITLKVCQTDNGGLYNCLSVTATA
ncbi:hypothetical protein LRD69_00975 [Streptomyces sp. JH14]|uniref:hypothetical protein n=1 Tax=Streptomyces sp. JH14 TaxID=2793630 RepID=UPI0023F9B704|nr:hypothetical protein [Streptomyces sp. JH14]MDF6040763.1 hypothetical protein [Streptomyces sp. JH14]